MLLAFDHKKEMADGKATWGENAMEGKERERRKGGREEEEEEEEGGSDLIENRKNSRTNKSYRPRLVKVLLSNSLASRNLPVSLYK